MADEIKLKAPTVEQQVVVNINGEDKLKSFADTLDKISNNKNLQKYWKTQQDLINATADAYSNFQKKASKDNASELIKVTNALKAMSGTDLSHILPDFDKISKSMSEAQKVAGNIDSAFSVKGFKEAFDSFETLKAYGTDVQKLFSHFGVSSDIGELQQNVRLLEGEVERLTRRLSDAKNANEELRNEFENFKVGSGFADKLDELDRLKAEMQNIRDEATQTFNQFLDANKIDRYDWFSDDRFAEYFEKLENGTLTATDAIRRFKSEYSYLLEDSYKSNGDSFGLDQLQVFSTKFDSIFHQVEETSNKINDILSNGVIAKSVQNLSEDTTLSDSQRSIFGNILQDEESLKSITALFQKLIDETNQTKNTEVFNTEQFTKLESLFRSIESSLSSIKGVLVDVGDGEELSPLLKQLDNIREATSNIKLSLNLDLGNEVSERLNQKVSQSTQRQLEAYRKLFSAMKGTGKTNKEMLKFFEPDEASATELIGAYQGIIKRAEEKFKVGNSNVYKKLLGSTYDDLKKEIKNANAQLGRAENKRSENGILGDLFGNSKDLSGVIEQLNTIISKLDEISVSAKGFTETLKNGLNVNASVDEIEKLTNRVKELESELAKIKTPTTIPSKDMKDAFPSAEATASVEKTTQAIKEENSVLDETVNKAKQAASELAKTRDIISQNWYREKGTVVGKDSKGNDIIHDADEFSFVERLKNGQLQTVLATYNEETGKWVEQIVNVRTAFEQVEKAIISADNKIASLEMARDKTLAAHPGYDATADQNQIDIEKAKRDELQQTLNLYGKEKEYVFEIEAANKRIADNQERLNNKKQSQTNLRQAVSDEQFLKDWDAAIAENNKRDTESAKQTKKELDDAWNEAVKVNTALGETKATLSSLSKMPELASNFSDMESKISNLNSDLTSGKITLSEYKNEVKSVTSEYSKMVSIQQKRDVEDYNANAKADNAKKLEREKQIWNELTTSLDRYATIQKRIASNSALSTDNEEATKLLEHIHELQRNDILPTEKLTASNEKLQQINQTVADLKAKLKESTLDSLQGSIDKYQKIYNQRSTYSSDFTPSEQYTKNLTDLNTAIKKLVAYRNTLKNVSEVTVEQETHLKGLVTACEKASDSFKSLSASEKGASQIAVDKLVQRINKDLDECTNYSKEAKLGLRALRDELESANPRNLKEITSEIINIENAEIRAGRAGRSFIDTLKNSGFHQIAAQMAGMFGVYDVINLGKEGFNVVRELNTALTEMRKVSDETVQSLKDYQATTFDTADAVGTTAKQIQNSTADWMRLGESMNQAAESAKDANVLLNVSEFEGIDEATESLVSMSQAYKDLDKMDIIDVLNNIGNNYSISTDGLATALKDSASALVTANNDLNEAVSLTTAGNAITQDPSKVGAGLRTISLRLVGTEEAKQELSDLGEETDGMITTVSKLRDTIMDATKAASSDGKGFDILDSNGNYKSTYEIMQGLADLYDNIVKKDKELGTNNLNLLLETIAGKNRANIAASILQNGDMLRSVYEDAQNSEGSAEKELNSYLDSIDGKMAQLENRAQEFWFKVIDSETIKNGIDLLSTLLKCTTDFVDTVGLLPTILTGIGAALSFKNVGRDKMYSLSF